MTNLDGAKLRRRLFLLHDEPSTCVTIAVIPHPVRTLQEFVVEFLGTAHARVGNHGLLILRPWVDVPRLEEGATVAHKWGRLAVGLGTGMPPEETRLLAICEPDDVGMGSQRLLVEDGGANVRLVVDEKVDRVIGQELVCEKQLEMLLAEGENLRKVLPRRC
jgi:hypothetical protein